MNLLEENGDESEEDLVKIEDNMCRLKFSLKANTRVGEYVSILGSTKGFGLWKDSIAHMKWNSSKNEWQFTITHPINQTFEYKYIITDKHHT